MPKLNYRSNDNKDNILHLQSLESKVGYIVQYRMAIKVLPVPMDHAYTKFNSSLFHLHNLPTSGSQ